MADIVLRAYNQGPGGSATSRYVYLDIVQDAKPSRSPEIKETTPLYSSHTYARTIRVPGRIWNISGIETAHNLDYLIDDNGLIYDWKVQSVNNALPYEIRALAGKWLKIKGVALVPSVEGNPLRWSIQAREVER